MSLKMLMIRLKKISRNLHLLLVRRRLLRNLGNITSLTATAQQVLLFDRLGDIKLVFDLHDSLYPWTWRLLVGGQL